MILPQDFILHVILSGFCWYPKKIAKCSQWLPNLKNRVYDQVRAYVGVLYINTIMVANRLLFNHKHIVHQFLKIFLVNSYYLSHIVYIQSNHTLCCKSVY